MNTIRNRLCVLAIDFSLPLGYSLHLTILLLSSLATLFHLLNCTKFSSGGTRGLACVQFLAALNIHLSGDKTISKDAMREFFHNLSMQALSKSDDLILLKFDAINRLNKRMNSLLVNKTLVYENAEI